MTLLPRGLKVHLALGYTDMRKGIELGLVAPRRERVVQGLE